MKTKVVVLIGVISTLAGVIYLFNGIQGSSIKNEPEVQRNGSENSTATSKMLVVVAFGDSLTAGYGVLLKESYPSLLEESLQKSYPNLRVINMGVSGETTTAGLDRVNFVIAQKPDVVLLGLGANDMLRTSSPAIAKENLRKMLLQFKEAEIPVVLLGMKSVASNGQAYQKEFDAIYPLLAQEYSIPLVPFFLEGVALDASLNTADGIHPNLAGYKKIVEKNMLPILIPVLKTVSKVR